MDIFGSNTTHIEVLSPPSLTRPGFKSMASRSFSTFHVLAEVLILTTESSLTSYQSICKAYRGQYKEVNIHVSIRKSKYTGQYTEVSVQYTVVSIKRFMYNIQRSVYKDQ